MALLVYSDKCKWSQDILLYIKTQPALLEIVRFWNINDQGIPSKKITRVPTLVTNDGKMLVGKEVHKHDKVRSKEFENEIERLKRRLIHKEAVEVELLNRI